MSYLIPYHFGSIRTGTCIFCGWMDIKQVFGLSCILSSKNTPGICDKHLYEAYSYLEPVFGLEDQRKSLMVTEVLQFGEYRSEESERAYFNLREEIQKQTNQPHKHRGL